MTMMVPVQIAIQLLTPRVHNLILTQREAFKTREIRAGTGRKREGAMDFSHFIFHCIRYSNTPPPILLELVPTCKN